MEKRVVTPSMTEEEAPFELSLRPKVLAEYVGQDNVKANLDVAIRAARQRGYAIARGRRSQLVEYIAYLVALDEQTGPPRTKRPTLPQALGLLARPSQPAPTDAEIEQMLDERRMEISLG